MSRAIPKNPTGRRFKSFWGKGDKMKLFKILKDAKTLLIDDDQTIRDVLHSAMTRQGCSNTPAATAEEGLRALEKQQFDIIICDLWLPGINGMEFFRRAVGSQPNSVKVLISGNADESAVAKAYEIGVHLFIQKPFSLTTLFDKLIPHIENRVDRINRHEGGAGRKADLKNNGACKLSGIAEDLSIFRPKKALDFNLY